MVTVTRRHAIATLGATALVGGLGGFTVDAVRGENPSAREVLQRRHLPDVELVTDRGDTVHFYDDLVKDKKVLINFMFAQCTGICGPVTANLVVVQRLLGNRVGRDIFMYSVTLSPLHDTPAVLARYAVEHGVGPGWLFLTGRQADIDHLRRGLGFAYANPVEDARKESHLGMLRYGDEANMRWASCPALSSPANIMRSIGWELGEPSGSA